MNLLRIWHVVAVDIYICGKHGLPTLQAAERVRFATNWLNTCWKFPMYLTGFGNGYDPLSRYHEKNKWIAWLAISLQLGVGLCQCHLGFQPKAGKD